MTTPSAPSAPTGDHGGLRGACERLADAWEGLATEADELAVGNAEYPTTAAGLRLQAMIRRRHAKQVRAALTAHPEPEPAQDGEVAE